MRKTAAWQKRQGVGRAIERKHRAFIGVSPAFASSLILLSLVLVLFFPRSVTPSPPTFASSSWLCPSDDSSLIPYQQAQPTLFSDGCIDLTGDGVPEHVRRVDGRLAVYSDGAKVWQSPTAWRVVDVALGDPNDDGRGEVLLALWKPGLDGLETPIPGRTSRPRSHPFIVGYRGGIYRTLWGGSAVSDPIHEVELGDVDGDEGQELVVLAGIDPDRRTVSVWRWHGWGFSLVWRSDPGTYRHLSVGEDGTITVVVD